MATVKKDPTRTKTPYVCRWRDTAGVQRKKGFARKVDADRFRAEVEHKLSIGTYIDPRAGKVTFRERAELWRTAQPHRPNTQARVKSQLKQHIYPAIGDRPMVTIGQTDLQGFVTGLPLAASTVRPVFAIVRAVFADAYRNRVIPFDPCGRRAIKLPELPIEQITPLTLDQVESLADAVPPRYRALVEGVAGAGPRQGESFGIEVEHIDFTERVVQIRQQLQPATGGGVVVCAPKNRHSYRTVPLAEVVVEKWRAHLAEFPAREVEVLDTTGMRPVRRMARFVFTDADGNPLDRNSFNDQVWNPSRAAAGLPDVGMHDLRHFYASLLIRAGLNPKVVAARLGHKDAAMTLRVYAHLWADDEDRSRQAIDDVFRRDVPTMRPTEER
ncbi:tyrosine-type recombinase/integrase [Plantactinospora solaniradicis]|uniref:Tyrosine-type recombinase/integrase n=1 Tax=Plantactinospora solaniradicis TaxID=1723736 RepID=A0ABW1K7X9_9ACTN